MVIHLAPPTAAPNQGRERARVIGELAPEFYPGQSWDHVEPQLAADWDSVRGNCGLTWADVRSDAHAAWQVAKLDVEGHLLDNAPVTMPG